MAVRRVDRDGQVLTLISLPTFAAAGGEAPSQTPCGPALALDWPDAALRNLAPDGTPEHDILLGGCSEARARGFVHHPATGTAPVSYAAPVRDFRGIVLAAIQLAQRAGEESGAISTPPWEAVVAAADALSAELGFEG